MPVFGKASLAFLATCHPDLQKIAKMAIAEPGCPDFSVICGIRGKEAQEAAFKAGNSKAHFGDSAHNATPPLGSKAFDFIPYPFPGWQSKTLYGRNEAIFIALQAAAKELGITLRWGGDFNMDGSRTLTDAWDSGHVELHSKGIPGAKSGWRNYPAK